MSKPSPETHNIVIIGGSFAGLNIAHKLLKKQHPDIKYTVTIISSSTRFYWTVGAPRSLLGLESFPLKDSFLPIAQGFEQYPAKDYNLIYASVTALDVEMRVLVLEGGGREDVKYDSLIIASGAKSTSPLWSLHGTHEATEKALVDVQARLPRAESILIAGGGAAGVESAGEFGGVLGRKEITILSGSTRLLNVVKESVGAGVQAQKQLEALGVKVVHGVKVEKTEEVQESKTKVWLSDGPSKIVDVYLDATGRRPNAPFVPKKFRDQRGAVVVDEHLAVVGAGPRVWAFGDVATLTKGGLFDIMNQGPVVLNNIEVALGVAKKVLKIYKMPDTMVMMVPTGPKGGVAVVFDWKLWSWLVWVVKSRDMMIGRAMKNVFGTA
ncbi:hypothetical protein DL95DRAFT_370348 [Leptodontidium sp. 2 PMI_412]|nr:hypothetical protein DL95DRAFT_370348 [Leptodontidium sp. 2 PMI_412]